MQLWGFQKVHRLFPTLSGCTVLSLKLTRKGRGRLKRPFIYIIFFPIFKIMPSESTLPLGSSTKSKKPSIQKVGAAFPRAGLCRAAEAARPAVWKPAAGAAWLRGDHVADARAPRRAEQPRSAGRGGRVGLALIRGGRTLRLRRHGWFVNRWADGVCCQGRNDLGGPPCPGSPPCCFVRLVCAPGAGLGPEPWGARTGDLVLGPGAGLPREKHR